MLNGVRDLDILTNPPPRTGELAERPPLKLGDFSIRPMLRTVSGPLGESVLEPRVMMVLLALADARGQVLSREMLERRCWAGLTVGEDSLTRAIGEIRRALRETGSVDVQLETIPKTGYLLLAEGAALDDAAPKPAPGAALPRRALLAGGAGAIAVAGLGSWAMLRPSPGERHVAELKAQGWDSWRQGLPEAEAQGLGFAEEAVTLAPEDAGAWGLLALLARNVSEMASPEQAQAALARSQTAARRALAIDPQEGNALAARAMMLPMFADWQGAAGRIRTVLAAVPSQPAALDALGVLQYATGCCREALALSRVQAEKDPLAAIYQHKLIYRLWTSATLGELDRVADRALSLWPAHPAIWFSRMWTYGYTGRTEEALRMTERGVTEGMMPPPMARQFAATFIAGASRRPADVAEAVRLNREVATRAPGAAVASVQHLAWLGDVDGAFEVANGYLLRKGPAVGSLRPEPLQAATLNQQHQRKSMMLFNPASALMRGDSRFLPLCEGIGLTGFWDAAGVVPDFLGVGDLV